MEHMGANERYRLVVCCPELRTLHTQIPLKMNHVILDTNGFTVDNVPHTLHTFISNLELIPPAWNINVPPGGFPFDIDKYGHRHVEDAIEGDITIQQFLVELQALRGPERHMRDALNASPDSQRELRWNFDDLQRQRRTERTQRERTGIEVETYLQYSQDYQYPQGVKLAAALRNLTRDFFSSDTILVNVLEIACPVGVLRFARDRPTFNYTTLKTGRCFTNVFDAITPILAHQPQRIDITVEAVEDPIFERERFLNTLQYLRLNMELQGAWVHVLNGMRIPCVECVNYPIYVQELVIIGQHWIAHPRPLGSKLSFELWDIERMNPVRDRLRMRRGTLENIVLPESFPHCEFVETIAATNFVMYRQKLDPGVMSRWLLIFEVMPIESVRPLE